MGRIKDLIEKNVSDIYVHSLQIGSDVSADSLNGFFMPVNDQIDLAYSIIKSDPKLANGYHAMGFSQGGQFLYVFGN
jgi:palmitoyl-protein thioesterase